MHLLVGDNAPDFSTVDSEGKAVHLRDFAGKTVFLCFYRYAGCPFCNLNLKEVMDFFKRFERPDFKVLAFFQSPLDSVREIPGRQHPPFPLIADPNREIYDRYGIEESYGGAIRSVSKAFRWLSAVGSGFPQEKVDGNFFLLPAQFLVSPEQKIVLPYYWQTFGDEAPLREVERYITHTPA